MTTLYAGQRLTASVLAALVNPGPWATATLAGTWTGSGGGANGAFYRLVGAGNWVEIVADVINTTATGSSTLFTLPAGYIPSVTQNKPASWNNPQASNAASAPWVNVSNAGTVQLAGIEVANKGIFVGVLVPLGAL